MRRKENLSDKDRETDPTPLLPSSPSDRDKTSEASKASPPLSDASSPPGKPRKKSGIETPSGEYSGDQTTHSLQVGDLTVEGYSRAAVQTFWRIPELKLGFDLGWQPWEYMGTPRWFISHTHMDHLLALPAYVARRRMMKMTPPVIYLPAGKASEARQLLAIFCRLDQGKLPCQFVEVTLSFMSRSVSLNIIAF